LKQLCWLSDSSVSAQAARATARQQPACGSVRLAHLTVEQANSHPHSAAQSTLPLLHPLSLLPHADAIVAAPPACKKNQSNPAASRPQAVVQRGADGEGKGKGRERRAGEEETQGDGRRNAHTALYLSRPRGWTEELVGRIRRQGVGFFSQMQLLGRMPQQHRAQRGESRYA